MPSLKNVSQASGIAVFLLVGGLAAGANADKNDAMRLLSSLHNEDVFTRNIDSDGADRIRLADRLTMLTQKVAASSCALTSDVAVEESYAHLEEAMYEIDIIIDALRHGNNALHILGPEKNRQILKNIEALDAEWQATHDAVDLVLTDGHDVNAAHVIDDHNLKLLELSSHLVSDITGVYSHPYEISQSDALMIKIAGRQRMLTQKMAKDACEVWTGYHADLGRADLEETMVVFESSLTALRDGMPAMGIQPAPTDYIRKDLDKILDRWAMIRGNLDKLLAGETLNMDQKYEIFHDFNVELEEIEHLIHDYKVYVERHHS